MATRQPTDPTDPTDPGPTVPIPRNRPIVAADEGPSKPKPDPLDPTDPWDGGAPPPDAGKPKPE